MGERKYVTGDTPASDMFYNAVSGFGVGSDDLTCDFCGRLHLCPDNEYSDRDDEDRASFREFCESEKAKNPDGVILHPGIDSITGHTIDGRLYVDDCPCNSLYKYEQFIWNERNTIRNYLKVRIEAEKKWAEQEHLLNIVAGIATGEPK